MKNGSWGNLERRGRKRRKRRGEEEEEEMTGVAIGYSENEIRWT